jgi:murein DD-endopeptidase MepM/ murein hydrolase activator NlpD
VDVLDAAAGGGVVLSLGDSLLARALVRPGLVPQPAAAERGRIGGGLRAIVFLWVPVDGRTPPARLRHRVTVERGTGDSVTVDTIAGETIAVANDVAVIGPPLRGGGWLAANGPAAESGHRRALVPVDGIPAIAQRFGIDYLRVSEAGLTFSGDRANNDSYLAEGQDALAVADGVVAATKDGIPENVPGINSRAVPITLETVGGNYVILDIGRGRYAFYAHLKPGSLRVKTGDRVKRGQVVGLVGNSGNSTEPHLHFHISDGTSPLGAQGVPYAFETFQLEGRCRRILVDCARGASPELRRREMPLANMIVRFPD